METIVTPNSSYTQSVIDAYVNPLFTISIEGKIMDINRASLNISDETREQLKGSDFFSHFTNPVKAREIYEKVFAGGFVLDFPLAIKGGKLTDVLFNGSVYKDDLGVVIGVIVVARDITDHSVIESELRLAIENAELAKQIAEQSKFHAEEAAKIAVEAVSSKQQFLSNMSHEIRTPMNAIIGFTKVLLKTGLSSKQRDYLNAIKLSGDALIVLINDILDLAKVDAGKMSFLNTPFKMAASISAMIHVFETKIQEKNLKLFRKYDTNIPKVLIGDAVRLNQIILNLISNAVKFTNEGSITISVTLLSRDEEKSNIEFSVSDTGIGISEDKIDHIFENFQQATNETSRLYGGTGLGLAIAKQLVESQGGKIYVKSVLNKGATFSFVLPFQNTSDDTIIDLEAAELTMEIKNIKVLVVEDIVLNQLLMKTLLSDFGFEYNIASNGKIAIAKMKKKEYDIILMDLQMPVMNGFETTKYIRETMHSKIPIIALTADVTTTDLQKCTAVGLNDYISKPINEKLLYKKILALVKKPTFASDIEITNNNKVKDLTKAVKLPKTTCIDLTYLKERTKSNPNLLSEMITIYLKQTPPLLKVMQDCLKNDDLLGLSASVHKLIPSFSIVGIHKDYENIAKQIQVNCNTRQHLDVLPVLVDQITSICNQACIELQDEYELIKK